MLQNFLVKNINVFKHIAYTSASIAVLYMVGWFFGRWAGNAELLLTVAFLFCTVYWIFDRIAWKNTYIKTPNWVSNTAGSFFVLLFVWSVRSFIWEPFFVPSGSMNPNLQEGDVLIVEKYSYGLKLPVLGYSITKKEIQAGDPIVFLYPEDRSVHFVKRVVGLPGDKLSFINNNVWINDKPLLQIPFASLKKEGDKKFKFGASSLSSDKQFYFEQSSSGRLYLVQYNPESEIQPQSTVGVNNKDCNVSGNRVDCTIPKDHVFVMGDHRDNSLDSRFWGFVPINDVKGKVSYVVLNTRNFDKEQIWQSLD